MAAVEEKDIPLVLISGSGYEEAAIVVRNGKRNFRCKKGRYSSSGLHERPDSDASESGQQNHISNMATGRNIKRCLYIWKVWADTKSVV